MLGVGEGEGFYAVVGAVAYICDVLLVRYGYEVDVVAPMYLCL